MGGADRGAALVLVFMSGWAARFATLYDGSYFHIRDPDAGGSSVAVSILAQSPGLGLLLLAYRRWSSGKPLKLVWFVLLAELAWFLPSGSRAPIVATLLGLLLLAVALRRPIKWLPLGLVFALTALAVFPIVQAYRGNDGAYADNIESSAATAVNGG